MAFARHLARQLKIMFLNIRGFEFIVLLLCYIRWRLGGGFHKRNIRGNLIFGERGECGIVSMATVARASRCAFRVARPRGSCGTEGYIITITGGV